MLAGFFSIPSTHFRAKGMNDNFTFDGLVEQRKELEALMASHPEMEKQVQKLIRKVLTAVRKEIGDAARGKIQADPRNAYKAVKATVYRRLLGGSVSILNRKNAKGGGRYEPQRSPSPRGGNRRARSMRTSQVMSYEGADRAFILRFINAGTGKRAIEFNANPHRSSINKGARGGNVNKYGRTVNTGNRGRITPRNFFADSSHKAMQQAAEKLGTLIDDMIKKEFK